MAVSEQQISNLRRRIKNTNLDYDYSVTSDISNGTQEVPKEGVAGIVSLWLTRLQNICWIVGAVFVWYYTDFHNIIFSDIRIKRQWFNVGVFLIGINLTIGLYLIVWKTYVKKIKTEDWDVHNPAAIPIATASFCFGSVCWIIALWPVWSYLTPLILFTFFMCVVVLITHLPQNL